MMKSPYKLFLNHFECSIEAINNEIHHQIDRTVEIILHKELRFEKEFGIIKAFLLILRRDSKDYIEKLTNLLESHEDYELVLKNVLEKYDK